MPDTYTTASSNQLGTVQAAYNRMIHFSLRPELLFDQVATVRATAQAMPGSSVIFDLVTDLAPSTTALDESTDATAVSTSSSGVTVTLSEYGLVMKHTAALRAETFCPIDPAIANLIGYNAGVSIDDLVRSPLSGGTNVVYSGSGTSRSNLNNGTNTAVANDFLKAAQRLKANNAPRFGGFYVAYVHPNVSYDVQSASGSPNWRVPSEYADPSRIYTGELGAWGGVRFIETPRAPIFGAVSGQFSGGTYSASGTSGNSAIFASIILGQQALAKAHSITGEYGESPTFVVGPVTDTLRRFQPVGWKHMVGYARFREACLYRLESISSLSATSDPTINQQ